VCRIKEKQKRFEDFVEMEVLPIIPATNLKAQSLTWNSPALLLGFMDHKMLHVLINRIITD
jgi:hypothetical protein